MRIIQLLPTMAYGDAVGNDTLAIGEALKEAGYETAIYAENIDKRLPKKAVLPIEKYKEKFIPKPVITKTSDEAFLKMLYEVDKQQTYKQQTLSFGDLYDIFRKVCK